MDYMLEVIPEEVTRVKHGLLDGIELCVLDYSVLALALVYDLNLKC